MLALHLKKCILSYEISKLLWIKVTPKCMNANVLVKDRAVQ